jgi:hypothetical protein
MREEKVPNNNTAAMYYHLNKFKYNLDAYTEDEDPEKIQVRMNLSHVDRQNKMSYCGSCDILRPPRSFHCSSCGCCVEVHDHHCPWVGTCVGHRNIRFFIGFIFWTSIHAFIVFSICAYSCFSYGINSSFINDTLSGVATKGIMVYTGIIGSVLFVFSIFQLF